MFIFLYDWSEKNWFFIILENTWKFEKLFFGVNEIENIADLSTSRIEYIADLSTSRIENIADLSTSRIINRKRGKHKL